MEIKLNRVYHHPPMIHFAVVYDNEAVGGMIPDWGFSCYIKAGTKAGIKILFDTGGNGEILLHNLNLLGLDDFDVIVLSHQHWDHIGGLNSIISGASLVFVPETFSAELKRDIARKVELIEVGNPIKIGDGIYTTGVLNSGVPEQSLLVETGKGVVVVTGCSHPGLDVILARAKKFGEVYGVIGGFHNFRKIEILKNLKFVAPCHCTVLKDKILKMPNSRKCYAGCVFNI